MKYKTLDVFTLFRKIKTALFLERQYQRLLPEVIFFILVAQLQLHFIPFQKLSASMGTLMNVTPFENSQEYSSLLKRISRMIDLVADNLPWEAACYPRALCAKLMLDRRNIESTLYIGVRKNDDNISKGHAWLRCGTEIVTGKIGHKKYQVIATYA